MAAIHYSGRGYWSILTVIISGIVVGIFEKELNVNSQFGFSVMGAIFLNSRSVNHFDRKIYL